MIGENTDRRLNGSASPAPPAGATATGSALSREDAFDLLSNARRRHVVSYLRDVDGEVSLRELSTQVAAWENDVAVAAVSSTQRKRVYTALHQSHLPKLGDAGVIDYDTERALIEPTARMAVLEQYLAVTSGRYERWGRYLVAIGIVSGAVSVLGLSGVVPGGETIGFAWAALTAAATTVLGYGFVVSTRTGESE